MTPSRSYHFSEVSERADMVKQMRDDYKRLRQTLESEGRGEEASQIRFHVNFDAAGTRGGEKNYSTFQKLINFLLAKPGGSGPAPAAFDELQPHIRTVTISVENIVRDRSAGSTLIRRYTNLDYGFDVPGAF